MSADAQAAPVTANGAPAVVEKPQETPTPTLGFKVFAGNLSYDTTDDGLKAFFAPVENDILSAQVIMRGTRSAGYGFVALASVEAAEKAVEALNKQDLDGRSVIIEIAKPADQKDQERKERRFTKRRPGRRGAKAVPGEVTEAEADGEAPKAEGEIPAEAPKPKKKKSSRKKKAAATPAEGEAAAEASAGAAENADAPAKKAPRPRKPRARPTRPAGEDPAGEPSKNTLFVANLGFNVDDDGLKALFTEAGIDVTSARIVRRRWNPRKSKGYGFVDVGSEENQKAAIEALDGREVAGRAIAVKIAVNTPQPQDEEEKPVDGAAEVPPADPAAVPIGF